MRKIAFAPLADDKSIILLLGTMPGDESLRKKQYYGNKNNHFWKIMYTLFDIPISENYEERKKFLLDKKIALWDVLQSCEGQGSLDSNIRNEQANDFERFYNKYPKIEHIIFTSQKAEYFYRKHVGFAPGKKFLTLPSPSPANARLTFSQKLEKWRVLQDIVS